MKTTLAARMREHAKKLAAIKTVNLNDKKAVEAAVTELLAIADEINDDGTLAKLRAVHLDVDDEFGRDGHLIRLVTRFSETLEVRTFWWDQLGEYITVVADPHVASFTVKRQTRSAKSAAINHLEIAAMARDGTLSREDARTQRRYGDDFGTSYVN